MNIDLQLSKIRTITSLEELRGYKEQARKRGIFFEELRALTDRQKLIEGNQK